MTDGDGAVTAEGKPAHRLVSTTLLAAGTFAVGTDVFVIAGFLPSMAADLGVSATTAGQAVTVFAVAFATLAPVLAAVTARVPRRVLLVAGLAVLCAANLVSALASGFGVFLASRVLAGVGGGDLYARGHGPPAPRWRRRISAPGHWRSSALVWRSRRRSAFRSTP